MSPRVENRGSLLGVDSAFRVACRMFVYFISPPSREGGGGKGGPCGGKRGRVCCKGVGEGGGLTLRADLREGEEDSNFSSFRFQRFSEWPEPLHWIAFPVEILTNH